MFVGPGELPMKGCMAALLCSVFGVSSRQVVLKANSFEIEAFEFILLTGLVVQASICELQASPASMLQWLFCVTGLLWLFSFDRAAGCVWAMLS
jgi:hypothetical protein